MALISVTEAFGRIDSGLDRLGVERVPISDAHGRVLATTLGAKQTQPPFDASAMDGYAVRWVDCAEASADAPVQLKIIGESQAGIPFDGEVPPNGAVRISTGVLLPLPRQPLRTSSPDFSGSPRSRTSSGGRRRSSCSTPSSSGTGPGDSDYIGFRVAR